MQYQSIPKNRRGEEYRLSVDDFQGNQLVNIRVWFPDDDGDMRPGRQGVAFRTELLDDFRDALDVIAEQLNG